jgi:periplasmic divalent cation tolerance protein
MAAILVMTTVGTEEQANLIAQELVARRHAACVNIVSSLKSVYRWQGKICKDSEYLLLVKTEEGEYDEIAAVIRELHTYEVPEILAIPTSRVDARFGGWISSSLDKEAEFPDEDEEEDLELDDSSY